MKTEVDVVENALGLPLDAIALAIELEQRGFRQYLDEQHHYAIEPPVGLSDDDRARIAQWRDALAVLVAVVEDRSLDIEKN
jgi:hypothetical protein